MSDKTGGSIYPKTDTVKYAHDVNGDALWKTEVSGGLTVRQYYAAKAMQGLIGKMSNVNEVSLTAFRYADAMIKFEQDEGK